MSDDRGSSTGTAEKKEECVKEFIVPDKFKKMMDDAFNATKSVLKKRAKNLKDWTENDKQEFSQIFGVSGDVIITSTYFAKRVADKLSENVDARTFMIDGVNRMIMICDSISVESRSCQNGVNLYGNFINNTHIFPGSARVNNGITIGLSPDQYKETLRIEILQNFKKKPFSGRESHVSTLCHELSHFCRYFIDGKHCGGMGTDDVPTEEFDPNFRYTGYARDLVKAHDLMVFKNAYNIERYFEIEP
ncbi:TPA: hypothetical protein ACWQLM_001071 [Escherichia coli]|nr:hypothetical protein [Escherichia coli]